MEDQEKELIEGYRKLKPESKDLILSTVITAVTAQEAVIRDYARRGYLDPVYALPGAEPVMEGAINV